MLEVSRGGAVCTTIGFVFGGRISFPSLTAEDSSQEGRQSLTLHPLIPTPTTGSASCVAFCPPFPQVNVVVVVDASPSIEEDEWELELKFATDTVEAFAKRGIFENGGTASYVQFAGYATNEGTFNSTESFNAHVDSVYQSGSGTDIVEGTQPPASA